MNFSASTYQNEFLPADATEVHAVVTVTSANGEGGAAPATAPEKVRMARDGSASSTPGVAP